MTPAEFIAVHGQNWKIFESSPIGIAFFRLIDDQHPIRTIGMQPEGNLLAGSAVFLNKALGYESLQQLIKNLGVPPQREEVDSDSDFATPDE